MPNLSPHAAQERCPYCSFQPTNMNDYCDQHRPKVTKMTKQQRVRRERNVLRADAIEGTDDAILRRVAQGIEYGIRWSTERTVGWPMPLEEAIELAKLIRSELVPR